MIGLAIFLLSIVGSVRVALVVALVVAQAVVRLRATWKRLTTRKPKAPKVGKPDLAAMDRQLLAMALQVAAMALAQQQSRRIP